MGVAGFLSACYVLLADRADAEDRAIAASGEEPHARADLDQLVGITTEPAPDEPPAETNIVELAAWIARNNN